MQELRGGGRRGSAGDRPGFGYLTETFAGLAGADVSTADPGSGKSDLVFGGARVESGSRESFEDTLSVFGLGE